MYLLKGLGLLCILVGASGAGYAMSRQVTKRYEGLKDLRRFTDLLSGEISYGNTPLPEALSAIGRRLAPPLSEFLRALSGELLEQPQDTLFVLFEKTAQVYLQKSAFTKRDIEGLCQLGSFLGYLDRDMQMRTLKLYQMDLDRELESLYESMMGRKKLYQCLGIMGGLFLVILLL